MGESVGRLDDKLTDLKVEHDIGVTVRVNWDSFQKLRKIAVFENEKVAVLCRRIIFEKIQVYERNPAYKRFLKRLEEEKT